MGKFIGDGSGLTNLPSSVPSGGIIIWSGSTSAVPSGWALCNGDDGTPNLIDRFVVGAGGSYSLGDTGGADSVALTVQQLPAHKHSASTGSSGSHNHSGFTNSAGGHHHSLWSAYWSGNSTDGLAYRSDMYIAGRGAKFGSGKYHNGRPNLVGTAGSHSHSLSINSNGAHTHTVSVGNTGSGQAHENRPPYYALAYIMKL